MPKVLIPLAQSCEELEAVTIIDLMRRAQFDVTTACLEPELTTIQASRGVKLFADTTLNQALTQEYDMIVLPGGLPGADYLNQDSRVIQSLHNMAHQGKYVAAICAAPRALATANLLEGKQVTSYPGTLDQLDIPGMTYVNEAVVVDGNIVTSRGPGTAMDFALTLIELLGGAEARAQVEAPLLR